MLNASPLKYQRILFKLSGEALGSRQGYGIDAEKVRVIVVDEIDAHLLVCRRGAIVEDLWRRVVRPRRGKSCPLPNFIPRSPA